MKVWRVTISTARPSGGAIGAYLGNAPAPEVSKQEHFSSQIDAVVRMEKIKAAVMEINLVPWLIDMKMDELEVKE